MRDLCHPAAVNETEEVEASKINLNRPFIILEKLDGSMVCPFYTEGKLRYDAERCCVV